MQGSEGWNGRHSKLLRQLPRLFFFCLIVVVAANLLSTPALGAVNQARVVWDPDRVVQSIGDGNLVPPVTVTFRVSSALTGVNVFTTPEIEKFVTVAPIEFQTLQPGTEYTLRLAFAVPPNASQGLYDGTVHLRLGRQTIPQTLKVLITLNFGGNIPSPTTTSLSQDSLQFLTGLLPGGSGLRFSQTTPELGAVRPGAVLALPPRAEIPYGFLGRVTGVSSSGPQLTITTVNASLSEAFTKASVSLSRHLTSQDLASTQATTFGVSNADSPLSVGPAAAGEGLTFRLQDLVLYDRDENLETTADQVVLDGSVSFDPVFLVSFAIEDSILSQLVIAFQLTENVDLTLKWRLEASLLEKEKTLLTQQWSPLVVWVGWVPVVIVPEASLVAGIKGSASAGIQTGVTQASSLTAGVGYANGAWQPIANFSNSFSSSGPEFSAGANVRAYAGPRFNLLLYGAVGPYQHHRAFGELDVDVFRTPVWQIFGGLEAASGVIIRIFDQTLANVEFPSLIQYRRLIAEGGIGAQGQILGSVRDAITRLPLANAAIDVYRDGSLIQTLFSNASGQFSFPALVNAVYRLQVSRPGYLPVSYNNITVFPDEIKTLDVILQIDSSHAGPGDVSGAVFNAISGAGVPALIVNLRQGLNTTSGPVIAATTTGLNGSYSFSNIPAGNYTAEASGAGFTNTYFPILCIGGVSTGNQNGVISPILPPDQTRIILTWGTTPPDLDSHFTGPLPGGDRFHMFYPYADSNSGSPWPTIVHLDLDDVTSFGPETTTLLVQSDGIYRFSVHDFTNRSSSTSAALSESQAQVRVYRGSNLVASFNVPTGQPGTLWTVFEMEGSTIRPINSMTFAISPPSIQSSVIASPDDDSALIFDTPPKQ